MKAKKQNNMFAVLFAIVAFVAGIIGIIIQGIPGLIAVLTISFAIFICYFAYYYLSTLRWQHKSHHLFSDLLQSEYLEWQQSLLEQIYGDLEFATIYGKRYPAALLRPDKIVEYPFDGLCQLQAVKLPEFELDRSQRNYLRILGKSLRAPKMKGFALSRIDYANSGNTTSFQAITSNQEQNLVTCHILEWELYRYFQKVQRKRQAEKAPLTHLPYRARYHNGRIGKDAISEPYSAYPLISVQAIVIFKDTRGIGKPVWRVVLAKRSEEVIVKPGFFQFQPAGGFEVYGSQDDNIDYLVRQGFDIGDALLREYAEELFNVAEFQENTEGRDAHSIRSHPVICQLIDAIRRKKAWFEFIGTVFDLTVLRPELSFLILIEDAFFCRSSLLGSWESMNMLSPRVDELGSILQEGAIHCGSAGLLQLAIENQRIQKLGIAKSLTGDGNLQKRPT